MERPSLRDSWLHACDGWNGVDAQALKTLERRVHPFIHSLRNRCITKLRRSIMNSIMPAANRLIKWIETADGWLLRALNSTGWYAVAGGAQRVEAYGIHGPAFSFFLFNSQSRTLYNLF